MDSDRAARIGYAALKKGKVVTVAGVRTSLMCFAPRLAPRSIVTKITRSWLERA